MGGTGSCDDTIPASPSEAFALVTDVNRLPDWNKIIRKVVECPDALEPGTEWVV
jgi:hypothetical protein